MVEAIEIVKGEDKEVPFKVINKVTGDPYDLTGKTLTAVIKACPNVAVATGAITLVNASLGKGKLVLTDVHTSALKKGITSWELEINDGPDKKIVQYINVLDVKERI